MPLPKVLSPKRLSNPLSLRVRDSSANASFTPVRSANQRHGILEHALMQQKSVVRGLLLVAQIFRIAIRPLGSLNSKSESGYLPFPNAVQIVGSLVSRFPENGGRYLVNETWTPSLPQERFVVGVIGPEDRELAPRSVAILTHPHHL